MGVIAPTFADHETITEAVKIIRNGGLVAFPTETVYGLGADAANPSAVRKIFAAKGRPADHPLIVHLSDSAKLADWAERIPDAAYRLAEQFWPGPLAFILNKKSQVPLEVTGGQSTVGLRVPNHPVALKLLHEFGGGIAAPSANRFCRISPTSAQHVFDELGDALDMILDGGTCDVGVESTIIDLSGTQPKLLRPGHISHGQIEAVLQTKILLPEHFKSAELNESATPRAPGMLELHYAPETKAIACPAGELERLIKQLLFAGKRIGLLTYQAENETIANLYQVKLANDAAAFAQGLYAALRQLDALQLDVLLVEQPPQTEAWRAVNDRLSKATVPF